MRRLGLVAFLPLLSFAGAAGAQQRPPPGQQDKSNSQFTLRQGGPGTAEAEAARGKAQAGDCAGALPLFDEALKTVGDPLLRRDRGLCHDKLGNAFPAVEDFRAYLTAAPDAPDAEAIRQRLVQLEPKTRTNAVIGDGQRTTPASQQTSADLYAKERAADKKHSNRIGPKPGEPEYQYEYYKEQERLSDEAEKSPLRNGTGLVLGLAIQVPRVFIDNGNTSDIGYSVAAAARYSTGRILSLIGEFGYAGIGTVGERTSQSAPLFMGGIELRIPFSKLATDHLLVRGGVGFERYAVQQTRFVTSDLLGRFGVGFRHVFGPSVGLELLVDGGPVVFFPERGDTTVGFYIAGSYALVVGF